MSAESIGSGFHNDYDDDDGENWMDTAWAEPMLDVTKGTSYRNTELKSKNIKTSYTACSVNKGMENMVSTETPVTMVTRMLLNDNKAGMDGLDKDKINQIILEASKGSKFFESERKKEEQMKRRIEEQRSRLETLTEMDLKQGECEADRLLESLEQARYLGHTIVHIDMDAFYAAVEMRDRPELKNMPMAVGGNSMLSTSNYHARKFGVRAAMPGFIARKLCPDLVIVPTNFEKYTKVSKQIREIMSDYDPSFCPVSLDEAYLNVTEYLVKRQNLTEVQRTFIVRKCEPHDMVHCLCDLNDVLKDRIVSHCSSSHFHCHNTSHSCKTCQYFKMDEEKNVCQSFPDKNDDKKGGLDVDFAESGLGEKANGTNNRRHDKNASSEDRCELCSKLFPYYEFVTFELDAEEVVQELRCRIEQKTRLTASAGIAPNMMLAKVCSDMNKPNGQFVIPPTASAVRDFIRDLPIRKISGIGKVSEQMLTALGVMTCSDLYRRRAVLYHLYSSISFNYFMRICLGIGSTTVERDGERKSISTERTFRELNKPADLYQKCLELCEALSHDLKNEDMMGKTVTLKLKTVNFEVKTKAQSLPTHTSSKDLICAVACALLKNEIQACFPNLLRLRLMGVRMSNILLAKYCEKQCQHTLTGFVHKLEPNNKQKISLFDLEAQQRKQIGSHKTENCQEESRKESSQVFVSNQSTVNGDVLDNNVELHQGNLNAINCRRDSTDIVNECDVLMLCKYTGDNEQTCCSTIFNTEKTSSIAASIQNKSQILFGQAKQDASRNAMNVFGCPVCGQQLQTQNLMKINKHIDTCLLKCSVSSASKNAVLVAIDDMATQTKTSSNHDASGMSEAAIQSMPTHQQTDDNVISATSDMACIAVNSPVCPICHIEQTECTLSGFNSHVDNCLSRGAIREILREQNISERQNFKRSSDVKQQPSAKKKKLNQVEMKSKSTSISSYFRQ